MAKTRVEQNTTISPVRKTIAFVVTLVALIALFFFAVNTGTLQVSPAELWNGLFVEYNDNVATIYDLRFPRIFIAMIGGAALAVSGVLLQAVVRNPLAEPGIIGINSGAAFTAIIITTFFPQLFYFTPLISFIGGLITFGIVYSLSWYKGSISPMRIILIGIAVSMMFSGLSAAFGSSGGVTSSVTSIIDANITMKTWSDLQTLAVYAAIGLVLSLFTFRMCDLLALEDKTARSLGVDVGRSRLFASFIAVCLASVTTSILGPISFLGLIVPHIARLLVGSSHRWLIPYSMVLGAFCLLLADTIGRCIMPPYEISAAVIMSIIGGPVFILLLVRAKGNYGE